MQQLEVGSVIEKYTVLSVLGQGGMAVVYKVEHSQLASHHALKILLVPSQTIKRRLMQEGRTQARIRHPNLVSVTDVIEHNGAPALVMEYVNGPTLEEWLADYRPTTDEALALFRGIVRGVGAAHREGLIHRDLKPANVLLLDNDEGLVPKVTDFGLVKEAGSTGDTRSGEGTPPYMSPEQIRNAGTVDQRSDMFALGCILYEMTCGRPAFHGNDTLDIYNKIASGDYVPPEEVAPHLPATVVAAIRRLLQVDPDRRPANCDVLIEILYGSRSRVAGADYVVTVGQRSGISVDDEPTPIRSRREDRGPALPTYPTFSAPESIEPLDEEVPSLASYAVMAMLGATGVVILVLIFGVVVMLAR